MWHAAHSQTSAHSAHLSVTPTANQSLAKHNRKPSQLAENKHQRPNSIATFVAFWPFRRASPTTTHESRHFYSIQIKLPKPSFWRER